MSKWRNKGNTIIRGHGQLAECSSDEIADQIVREHNAHAELVLCLKAMLKITCGECRGENPGKCAADALACALSAQTRAAIEAAEWKSQ